MSISLTVSLLSLFVCLVYSQSVSVSKTVVNGVEVPPGSVDFGNLFRNNFVPFTNNFNGFNNNNNRGSNNVNSVANAFSNGGSVSHTVVNGVEVPPGSVDMSQFQNLFRFPGFGAVSDTEETAEAAVDSVANVFSNGGSVSKTVVNGVEVPPSSFNFGGFNNLFSNGAFNNPFNNDAFNNNGAFNNPFNNFNSFGGFNSQSNNGVNSVANAFSNGGSVSKTVVNGVEVPPGSVDMSRFSNFFRFPTFAQSEKNEQNLEQAGDVQVVSSTSIPAWGIALIVIGALIVVALVVVMVQIYKLRA